MAASKIKILGIAPYEGMRNAMEKLAGKRAQIELDVYVGDLNKGVEIARRNFQSNYDVIISRGGTAEMIGKITTIPVIEITLSVYDILRAIKLAENYSDKYAIVGFPGITSNAHLLCDLLQYKIDIVTIHSEDEVEATLRDLESSGCRMILCDMITNTTAKKLGLNSILITSGNESIEYAFDQSIKLCSSYANIKEENSLFREIIKGDSIRTVVFDENQNIYFSTWEGIDSEFIESLRKEVPETLGGENCKSIRNIDGMLYSIDRRSIEKQLHQYAIFYISTAKAPAAVSKYGIHYSNKKEARQYFRNSFYSVTGSMNSLRGNVEKISQSSFPIMVTGEEGTGKDQIVRDIYAQSALQHNPLVTITCGLLNDKSWSFLTNHYSSPFNDNDNTIYFKDIDKLTEERHKLLLSMIMDMNLCKRNRVIFSCVTPDQASVPLAGQELVNLLSCLTIHLPPLRDHSEEFPTLSSLYLGNLNVELVKQIIGFEAEGMELLQKYGWPYNYTQFKRIITELAVITTTPYIKTDDVRALLEKEEAAVLPRVPCQGNAPSQQFDLNRTLDKITQDIILQVMNDRGGNQSAAAKQLGISRTTLWRYLNKE